jgi:hypothetical protein
MLFALLDKFGRRRSQQSRRNGGRHQQRPSIRPRSRPPNLEILEDRLAPSTLTVTNLSDHDPGSLRAQLGAAQDGDSINFQDGLTGTIVLTTGELQEQQTVTITGPGASTISLSGNNSSRIFEVLGGASASICGLTFTAGTSGSGGAVLVDSGGTLTLTNCTVSGNSTAVSPGLGGGICNLGVSVTLTNCTLSGNSAGIDSRASAYGGGLYNSSGTVTLTNCTLSGNSAGAFLGGGGGGLENSSGTVTLTNCTLSANNALGNGLGGGAGGGIENSFGTVTLTNCTFSANQARLGDGGGIYNGRDLTLIDCTFTANVSTAIGTSRGEGGGIYTSGSALLRNTIVALNSGRSDGDIFGTVDASSSYNLIGTDGSGGLIDGVNYNQVGVANPGLGTLADKGGPTQTIQLLAGSPALNAGDPAELGTADQRGVTRSGGVNIGAYQASASAFMVTAAATVQAGTPFDVTVTAEDPFGQVAVGYTGTVTFSSQDPYGATLPADYTFQPGDAGQVTFAGGATLYTAGTWDVTVTDTATGASGSAYLNVTPAPAVAFQILAPASVTSGQAFDITLIAEDPYGNTDTNYQGTVHFTSTDPDQGVMLPADCTFQASDAGMVTFPGGVTLITLGDQTITATDTVSGITGSATVTVGTARRGAGGNGGRFLVRAVAPSPGPESSIYPNSPSEHVTWDSIPSVANNGNDRDVGELRLESGTLANSDTRLAAVATGVFLEPYPGQQPSGQPGILPLESMDAFYEVSVA